MVKFIAPRINRKLVTTVTLPVLALGGLAVLFNSVFFYNEAGQMTHVRTIFGEEKVVEDVGYATKWFGRSTVWRRTIGVQSALQADIQEDRRSGQPSIVLPNLPIVFTGNVDAKAEFSTQFRLPSGEAFLKIAQNTERQTTSCNAPCCPRSRKPSRPQPR